MATSKVKASATPKAPKNAGPTVSSLADSDDKKWRAEDDLRTLIRAEEIKADRDRMKTADNCRKDQMRNLAAIKVEVAPRTIKAPK